MSIIADRPHTMTNSHILVNGFDYYEPVTLEEAITLADKFGEKSSIIAGGTQLLIQMKMERDSPETIISINKIPGLGEININEKGELLLGPLVNITTIATNPYILANYTAMAQSCQAFGSTQIEIMGTIGGNLCNGSPASDTVPALLIFDALLVIKGPRGERKMQAEEFILSPGKIALEQGEILTSIVLPPPVNGAVSTFIKITRVAADLSKASIAALIVREGEKITDCRMAFGSVAPKPIRIKNAEKLITGQEYSSTLFSKAGEAVEAGISPIDDIRSTAIYRRRIVNVFTQDALCSLWERSKEEKKPIQPETPPAKITSYKNSKQPMLVRQDECKEIELTVNGKKHRLAVAPNELLLNVLRERLQLTGTKYGCGVGECSACTIHLNGKPALSCLVLAISANGKEITTIEGLQTPDGELDPLQESFIENGAFQCGYCTPGILMTLKGLLREIEKPDEGQIRDYLKGNRCRCTGYTSIVRAVMATLE